MRRVIGILPLVFVGAGGGCWTPRIQVDLGTPPPLEPQAVRTSPLGCGTVRLGPWAFEGAPPAPYLFMCVTPVASLCLLPSDDARAELWTGLVELDPCFRVQVPIPWPVLRACGAETLEWGNLRLLAPAAREGKDGPERCVRDQRLATR
jgi:hypothetical protein